MSGSASPVQELNDAVTRFGEAWAAGDLATLEAMLSPGYTHADAYGRLQNRSQWLDYARRRKGRTTQIVFRDLQIRVIGDVAVVTGINDLAGSGVRQQGDKAGLTIRFTQLWVFWEGRWLREAFQATPCQESASFA